MRSRRFGVGVWLRRVCRACHCCLLCDKVRVSGRKIKCGSEEEEGALSSEGRRGTIERVGEEGAVKGVE